MGAVVGLSIAWVDRTRVAKEKMDGAVGVGGDAKEQPRPTTLYHRLSNVGDDSRQNSQEVKTFDVGGEQAGSDSF